MYYKELIYVGNPEKGYALFDKTNGEFMTGFDYTNIVNTDFGIHFLFKGSDNYKIVDSDGKEVVFDEDYFWGTLSGSVLGVGSVYNHKTNKCYLGNFRGEILSKGYDGRICVPRMGNSYGGIFETKIKVESSGRVLKGLISLSGEEVVPCEDDYIPEFDNIFVLAEKVEKYGLGLIAYADRDILSSHKAAIKLLESAMKFFYNVPDSVDKGIFRNNYCHAVCKQFTNIWVYTCFEKGVSLKSNEKIDEKEVLDRFDKLIDDIAKEFDISSIGINCLRKDVENSIWTLTGKKSII